MIVCEMILVGVASVAIALIGGISYAFYKVVQDLQHEIREMTTEIAYLNQKYKTLTERIAKLVY